MWQGMRDILHGLKGVADHRSLISGLPPTFFVWSNDLDNGFYLSCVFLRTDNPSTNPCPYSIDWDPAIYTYDELIQQCPNFSSALLRAFVAHYHRRTDDSSPPRRDLRPSCNANGLPWPGHEDLTID
jgi:hypothetical protein